MRSCVSTYWPRYVWWIVLLLSGCKDRIESVPEPPAVFVDQQDTRLRNTNGTWLFNGTPYAGYIVEKQGSRLLSKLPVINGKEHGIALGWYPTGHKRYERGFRHGDREGIHQGWYPTGTLSFQYTYMADKYEGEQRTFFENGHRWQSLHYVHGYEEGKQKTWNDSGRVINNFTVKKGKLYGVIGRYDCMSVTKK